MAGLGGWAFLLALGGATAALFLAGGAPQGNLGVFLLCAGGAMIACPPQRRVPPRVAWAAGVFLALGALPLLPARLVSEPAWRRALHGVPDLPLPGTVSAAPAQTLFWLAVLAITAGCGLFLLTQPVRSRRLLALALTGAGVCGTYAALSIFAKLSGWTYPFTGGATFGFLPNRNHTATLLITGSVLSLGVMTVAFRERRWLTVDAAVAALALCCAGLFFFSGSRAGVLFLLVGLAGWVAGLGGLHRNRPLLLAVVVAALVGTGLFFAVKSDARDRLLGSVPTNRPPVEQRPAAGQEAPADDRLKIYHDTLGIIREAPLTGTGLGTFALVFPSYRQRLISASLVLHPESDWLMAAAEMGLPACLCLAALCGLVLRAWRPDRQHPYWPLRWGVFVAAATGLLHGLVDVPVHRAALGWWLLVLVGLALQPGSASSEVVPSSSLRLTRVFFAVLGVGALLLGGQLIRAEWLGGPALPPFAAARAQAEILRTFNQGDPAAAMEQARQAVQRYPLAAPLYYQLGVLLLRFEGTDAEADRAFRLQRLLEPLPPDTARAQGVVWLPLDPARSAALFVEAQARQERLCRAVSTGLEVPASYLRELVRQASGVPQTQELLWATAASRGAEGRLAWLEGADPEPVKARLASLAQDEAFLSGLGASQRRRFLAAWSQKGDKEALQDFLAVRPNGWTR